jgi:hypothetical protein
VVTDLDLWLVPRTVLAVWRTPALLASGLAFTFAALTILLCHEMGHWLACRRYRLEATPPYFLPLPLALGTLGAFIRIRSPIRHRRMLFDVGAAGPFAGFVALLPFLFYGVAHSPVSPLVPGVSEMGGTELLLPGRAAAFQLVVWLFHGRGAGGGARAPPPPPPPPPSSMPRSGASRAGSPTPCSASSPCSASCGRAGGCGASSSPSSGRATRRCSSRPSRSIRAGASSPCWPW